ncbi:MAG: HRDC domain-containing protein [Planctomycetota bacterium]
MTLHFCPQTGAVDDRPLTKLAETTELLAVSTSFFETLAGPIALCAVTFRSAAAATAAMGSGAATDPAATSPQKSEPPPRRSGRHDRERQQLLASLPDERRSLFEDLRRWRMARAREDGVPPYVIFTDAELGTIVTELPRTLAALQRIDGIGPAKSRRYGEALLDQLPRMPTPRDTEAAPPTGTASTIPRAATEPA